MWRVRRFFFFAATAAASVSAVSRLSPSAQAPPQVFSSATAAAFIEINVTYSFKVNNKVQFYGPGEVYHQFETEFVGNVKFWRI